MKLSYLAFLLESSLLIVFAIALGDTGSAFAQASNIVPDDTLGNENSEVIENFNGLPVEVITGGAQREQNLFHSFQEFNVSEGRGAYFNVPNAEIQNILSRITDNNPSEIMGVLGTFGESNLFLINPNGIIFGEGARLDVQGSFAATTANGIEFGEQGNFAATNPQIPQLLTINPSAFLFNQIQDGATIENRSIAPSGQNLFGDDNFGLRVSDGKNFSLLGGNINISGNMYAFGGRINIGGLTDRGKVDIAPNGNLIFPHNIARADVLLTNETLIDTTNQTGGTVRLSGSRISLRDESNIFSLTLGSQKGGNIILDATESVELEGNSFPSRAGLFNASASSGEAGDIEITTKNLTVRNGARISTIALARGQGGDIKIDATESVRLLGDEAGRLPGTGILTGGGLIAESRGSGTAGNIEIATGNLVLKDKMAISVDSFDVGVGGDVNIQAENISIQTGSTISASTFGLADAGNVTVRAKEIEIDGVTNDDDSSSSITTQTGGFILPNIDFTTVQDLTGNAGDLTVDAERLILQNGARIKSSTFNAGSAGSLKIKALQSIDLIGAGLSESGLTSSGLFADTEVDSSGNAGELIIETASLSVIDGAQIGAGSRGNGQGGRLNITAFDSVQITGRSADGTASGLFTSSDSFLGVAGDISLSTTSLDMQNGGRMSSRSLGMGSSGNLSLDVGKDINISDGEISTVSLMSSGGNINIDTQDMLLKNTNIASSVFLGTNNGGNIQITADSIVAFDDSDILAFAADGQGGNITLDTPAFFAENFTLNSLTGDPDDLISNQRADINASGAVSGFVTIPDVSFIQNSLTELPDNAIDTDSLVANSCVVRSRQNNGSFIITGGEGLPVRPGNAEISEYPTGEVRNVTDDNSSWQPGEPIIEPQGMYRLNNGKLVLSRECS